MIGFFFRENSVNGEAYSKTGGTNLNLFADSNWFVLFVQTGQKLSVAEKCALQISKDLLKDVFIPKRQKWKQTR